MIDDKPHNLYDQLRALSDERREKQAALTTLENEEERIRATLRAELTPDETPMLTPVEIQPTFEPGRDTSEYALAAWTTKLGGVLATVGGLVAIVPQFIATRYDLAAIGAALAAIGAALSGKTASDYGRIRTQRKVGQ